MTRHNRYFPLLALGLSVAGSVAWADEVVNISVNTSSLAGQAGSEVFFELVDGSGTGNGLNTTTMSNFVLGGGSAGAVDPFNTFGGASGDMGSTVSINDNSPESEFAQLLTPGTSLAFKLDLTNYVEPGPIPDAFYMFVTNPGGTSIANTSDPTGFNSLFAVTFNSSLPSITNYDSSLVSVTSGASVSAPEIDPQTATSGLAFLAACLAVLCARRR